MSLINDALKKAQSVRYEEPVGPAEPANAGKSARIAKRGRAHSANTTILLGSGAIVLVVLSVVATVYLVNRTPDSAAKSPSASLTPSATKSSDGNTTPNAVAPKLDLSVAVPKPTSDTATTSTDTAARPGLTALGAEKTDQTSSPVAAVVAVPAPAAVAPASPPPAPTRAKPDEQTLLFVESIKVAGVRSSGNESRVLMNERVYRVNDIVERNLGLKLIGVAAGTLTFSDSAGATYVKNF